MAVPTLPQRIALVGSAGTSGFRDFCTKVTEHLIASACASKRQSSVQGFQPRKNWRRHSSSGSHPTGLIVLVRGGGGKLDLDAYNDFELCLAIARSTAPVWTGIGHESDLVVADLVAHTAWKTPTEVAVGVVKRFEEAAVEVDLLQAQLEHLAQTWLVERHREFESHWERIASASRHALNRHRLELQNLSRLLHIQAPALIERHRYTLREMRSTVARAGVHSIENAGREIRFIQQRLRASSGASRTKTRPRPFQTNARCHRPENPATRIHAARTQGESFLSGGVKGEQLRIQARDGELDVTVTNPQAHFIVISHHGKANAAVVPEKFDDALEELRGLMESWRATTSPSTRSPKPSVGRPCC